MMNVLIIFLFFISFDCFSNERGNGGGPYDIYTESFPKHINLEETLNIISEKVSRYPWLSFLSPRIQELRQEKVVQYIPKELIIANNVSQEESHVSHLNYVTAFTYYPSKSIYVTKAEDKLNEGEFTKLILHELLHYGLPASIRWRESIVSELTEVIFKEIEPVDNYLQRIIKIQFDPSSSIVRGSHIVRSFVHYYRSVDHGKSLDQEFIEQMSVTFEKRVEEIYYENLKGRAVNSNLDRITDLTIEQIEKVLYETFIFPNSPIFTSDDKKMNKRELKRYFKKIVIPGYFDSIVANFRCPKIMKKELWAFNFDKCYYLKRQ